METFVQAEPAVLALSVTGITCGGCALVVERALSKVPGVERVSVDADLGLAVVVGSSAVHDLIRAVEAAGYGARLSEKATAEGESNEHRRSCCCA